MNIDNIYILSTGRHIHPYMYADPLWPISFVNYFDFEPALDEMLCCPKRLHVWLVLPVATLAW